MIRTLLATTAIAAILVTGAVAQDASSSMEASTMSSTSSMPTDMSSSQPMTSESSMQMSSEAPMASQPMDNDTMAQPRASVDILSGYTRVDTDQLASRIIGAPVFDSGSKTANNLGSVKDLVLNQNGEVAAVVLGVGGFLGLGEKKVAVDFRALKWVIAEDNTERWVLATTKDELTNAPDFQTVDDQPGDTSAMASSAPAQ